MLKFKRKTLPVVLAVCMTHAQAADEEDLFSLDIEQLLEVEVYTASKRNQKVADAPSIVTAFTRDDIRKMGVTSLIDVLKHAPGIETSMAPDGHWRVSIRGDRKDGTILLLVDGHPFNDFYDGRAILDLPLGLIKQVEIIRGPGSALYGTNAVAGVVNVITDYDGSHINASVQTHQGYQLSGHHQFELQNGALGVNLGLYKSDGANVTDDDDALKNNVGTTNRHISQFYFSSNYQLDNLELNLLALVRERGPWVGPNFLFAPNTEIRNEQYSLRGNYLWQINDGMALEPYLDLDVTHHDGFNEDVVPGQVRLRNLFPDGGYTKEHYKTGSVGLGFDFDAILAGGSRILTGVSFQQMSMEDYELTRNYQVIGFVPKGIFGNHDQLAYEQRDKKREVFALYAQGEIPLGSLSLTLGLRYDDYSDFGHSINPRFGAIYQPLDHWQFKLLYGSAFRAPTFKELYDNTRIGVEGVIGNTALQPEESNTWEVSAEYQSLAMLAKLNFYRKDATNVIDVFDEQGSGARGSIENIGDIETEGAEFEITRQFGNSVRLSMNYSRFQAEFVWGDNPLFDGVRTYLGTHGDNELFNQPRTRANLTLDWAGQNWQWFAAVNYGGRASHNNTLALEGLRKLFVEEYVQFDVSLSYRFDKHRTVTLSANNLGGDRNSDPSGSPDSDTLGKDGLLQPSETVSLTFNYQF